MDGLRSINVLSSYREGDPLPHLQVDIAVPVTHQGTYLSHTVTDAVTGEVVATWPLNQQQGIEGAAIASASRGQLAYQQVSHAPGSRSVISVGAKSFAAQTMQVGDDAHCERRQGGDGGQVMRYLSSSQV